MFRSAKRWINNPGQLNETILKTKVQTVNIFKSPKYFQKRLSFKYYETVFFWLLINYSCACIELSVTILSNIPQNISSAWKLINLPLIVINPSENSDYRRHCAEYLNTAGSTIKIKPVRWSFVQIVEVVYRLWWAKSTRNHDIANR